MSESLQTERSQSLNNFHFNAEFCDLGESSLNNEQCKTKLLYEYCTVCVRVLKFCACNQGQGLLAFRFPEFTISELEISKINLQYTVQVQSNQIDFPHSRLQ